MTTLPVAGKRPYRTELGGYPLVYYTRDGLTLCPDCANKPDGEYDDNPVAMDVYWEGPVLFCDDCNGEIESAYGDPGDPEDPNF